MARAAYGFYKSNEYVGWNYAYMDSTGRNAKMTVRQDTFAVPMSPLRLPFLVLEPKAATPVCYPTLSGRVTVAPNSVRLTIAGTQFAPADREIVVANRSTGTVERFPRDVPSYELEVPGLLSDSFQVLTQTGSSLTPVQKVTVSVGGPGMVTIWPSVDAMTQPFDGFVVRNLTTGQPVSVAQRHADVTVSASGGDGDGYEVSVVDFNGTPRPVQAAFASSPFGSGNLVLRVATGTIDPNRAEMDAAGLSGRARTRVELTSVAGMNLTVPDSAIVNGGTTYAFNGSLADRFTLGVQYDDGYAISTRAPAFTMTIASAATGRVIREIVGQSPPRDAPQQLGRISDDVQPPFIIGGPSRLSSFDPAGLLSFTFSEPMDAASVKQGIFVTDRQGAAVSGEVRISNGNQVATFVPVGGLRMDETYTVRFVSTIKDGNDNVLPPTSFVIKTFKPRRLSAVPIPATVNDLTFVRKKINNLPETALIAVTNAQADEGKVVAVNVTDAARPTLVGSNNVAAATRRRVAVASDVTITSRTNETITGDIVVASTSNLMYSILNFYRLDDLSTLTHLANKIVTVTPDFLSSYNQKGTYRAQGFARGVALLEQPGKLTAFAAIANVGIASADVGGDIPEPIFLDRFTEPLLQGDFVDVTLHRSLLVAVQRTPRQLVVVDGALAVLAQVTLPDEPIRVVVVESVPVDDNLDGTIDPGERRTLAAVGSASSIAIVDITDFLAPAVLGTIPMSGGTHTLSIDTTRFRLYAATETGGPGTPQRLSVIDLAKAKGIGLLDRDGDQKDDRLIWSGDSQLSGGVTSLRVDSDRGLLYVGRNGAIEIWTIYDNCCDLGVDMAAELGARTFGDRRELLQLEKEALQKVIAAGVASAAGACQVDATALTMLEQGSGACLWKGDPAKSCADNYQPGISDHDIEVFLPDSQRARSACVIEKLDEQVRDPVTRQAKQIELRPGVTVTFDDLTFYAGSREEFESASMNVQPPSGSGGADSTGDLGLGRQQLLLKWLLEGEYVDVPQFPSLKGKDLETVLTTLRDRGENAILRLEGHEWTRLQQYAMAKSKVYWRVAGASNPASSLYPLFQKQLHDAAKAGIRAAMARMVADADTNQKILTITRASYQKNACLGIQPQLPRWRWGEKPCGSFEEYVASTAARTRPWFSPSPLFTDAQIVDEIYRFYKVKADLESIKSEQAADDFVALAATFVLKMHGETQGAYTLDPLDPNSPQRAQNMTDAVAATDKALKEAKLTLVPHFYNIGFRNAWQVRVAMYPDGQAVTETVVDLAGGDHLHPVFARNDDGSFKTDPEGRLINLFVVGPVDQTAGFGLAKAVVFTIDLPGRTVKEGNRQNNVGGFFYYMLDPQSPAAPTVPPQLPQPVPQPPGSPPLLDPDPECTDDAALRVSQQILAGGQTLDSLAVVGIGEKLELVLTVRNLAPTDQNVTVCSSFTNACYNLGTLSPGQTVTKSVSLPPPTAGFIRDGVATAISSELGVVVSAPLRLVAGNCESYEIIPLYRDPNPAVSEVMLGGKALRYYKVVNRRTGEPVTGATVDVTANADGNIYPFTFTTSADPWTEGWIVEPNAGEQALAIGFDDPQVSWPRFDVSIDKVNGVAPACSDVTRFPLELKAREYSRTYNRGSKIEGSLSLIASAKGSLENGFSMTRDEQYPTRRRSSRSTGRCRKAASSGSSSRSSRSRASSVPTRPSSKAKSVPRRRPRTAKGRPGSSRTLSTRTSSAPSPSCRSRGCGTSVHCGTSSWISSEAVPARAPPRFRRRRPLNTSVKRNSVRR